MSRRLALLALIACSACTLGSGRRIDRAYAAAQQALWRGEMDAALADIDRGLELAGPGSPSKAAWKLRLLRAEVLIAKPDLARAVPLLTQPLPDTPELAPLRARQKYLVAKSQVAQGRLADAMRTLDEVGRLAPEDRETHFDAEILGGQARLRLGKWSDAESRLAAVVADAQQAGDRFHQALALNNLGMGRMIRGRWDEALAWFQRVLAFADLDQMLIYSAALNNAGACYSRLGQFDRAVAIQQRAVDMQERRGSAVYQEQALGELGSTYFLQNDVDRAVPYFQRALKIAEGIGNTEDASLWAGNLAAAAIFSGRWDDADKYNDDANRLNRPQRANRQLWTTLYAGRIAAGRQRYDDATKLFDTALAGSETQPRVRWAAHEGLAGVAIARGDRTGAARHFESALDTIERTRSDLLKADYKISFLTELIRFYRSYVDLLVGEGAIDRALEVADSSRGRVLADRQGVVPPARGRAASFREIAAQSNSVLVSYWLAPSRSYVWIVDRRGVRVHELPPSAEIDDLAGRYLAAIQSSLSDPLAAKDGPGDKLFRMLVPTELQTLPAGTSVVIVPDGPLHGLNFETLPVAGPHPHYWLEDVEIQIAPALGLLSTSTAANPAPPPPPSLLLIGNPTTSDPQFPELRYASAEMASIARHFGPDRARTYQRAAATPAAYRESRPEQFTLVHFTAHADPNRDSPLDSAVILAGPQEAFKLYARDVAERPLHAELVTVSACRSAGERAYSGEGLVGFAWAFLRAGARRVIAGLWDVDDRSTAELMDALYDRLAKGEAVPRALRDAKLSFLKRGGTPAKPYYWGPFQVFTVVASSQPPVTSSQ